MSTRQPWIVRLGFVCHVGYFLKAFALRGQAECSERLPQNMLMLTARPVGGSQVERPSLGSPGEGQWMRVKSLTP